MEAYGLCVESADPSAGSTVLLEERSASPDQRFTLEGGIIKLDGGGQADPAWRSQPVLEYRPEDQAIS